MRRLPEPLSLVLVTATSPRPGVAVGDGVGIGVARGEAKDREGRGVVPSTEHGVDGAGDIADGRVLVERLVEIEARRDAEAFKRGAEDRDIGVRGTDHDADFAERTAGGGLFENAAGDFVHLALKVWRADELARGMGGGRGVGEDDLGVTAEGSK